MTTMVDTKPRNRLTAKRAVLLALAAAFLAGTFTASASADDRRGGHPDFHGRPGDRGYPPRGDYYRPPPVAYGGPYYPPPPVAYGPGVGINLPGVNINIR